MKTPRTPRRLAREFDDQPFGTFDLDVEITESVDTGFEDVTTDRPETPEPLTFPATQTAIAAAVGLTVSTVHGKLSALADLHGRSLIFTVQYGEKRVTQEGYGFLQDLIKAGNIKEYRRRLDAIAAPAPTVSHVPGVQIPQPIAQNPHAGTQPQIPRAAHLSLVPTNGTPTQYAALGFPSAAPAHLSYYQPTALAPNAGAMVDLVSQLSEVLADSLSRDAESIHQETQAIKAKRRQLQELMPLLESQVSAHRAMAAQATFNLEQEKKSLAKEAAIAAQLAEQIGYSIPGLDGLF